MARSATGSLLVRLGLDDAEFRQGLTRSEFLAQKWASSLTSSLRGVGREFALSLGKGLATVLSVHELVKFGEGVLDNAEKLGQLSQETGSSVEQLSRLENATKLAGGGIDDLRGILDKFAAGLGGAEEHGTRVAEVMRLLGVNAKDPAQAMEETARKLSTFADGANKAALAREAFGRGGIQFIDALSKIAESSGSAATKTTEQIKAAQKLQEEYRTLTIASHGLADAFLGSVVPALSNIIGLMNDAATASGGFWKGLLTLTHINPFESTQENIDRLRKQIDDINKDPGILIKLGIVNKDKELAELRAALDVAQQRQLKEFGGPPTIPVHRPQAPQLPEKGEAEAQAKRLLEGRIKALEAIIRDEEDALKERERFMQAYFQDDLISIDTYFGDRQSALDRATATEIDAYNKIIEAQRQFQSTAGLKGSDRLESENKIADAIRKRAKLEESARSEAAFTNIERERAVRQFTDSITELKVRLLDLQGASAQSADLGFDLANRQLRDRINLQKQSNDEALRAAAISGESFLNDLKERNRQQAELTKATREYSNVTAELSIEQGKINLLQQTGAITEIDALNKQSALAKQFVQTLTAQADALQKLADAMSAGPERDAALLRVKQLRLEIDQLAASANALQDKFREIFTGEVADFFTAVITRTKSVKDAFLDLEKNIVAAISRIAAKNLAEALFGSSGAGSGIPAFFASLFGGGTGAANAGGFSGTGFANGTNFAPGGWARVGEHGPETMFVPRGAQITPAGRNPKSNVVNINVNVLPGASRASADQAAAATGIAVRRAMARNV